jgi:hypothetical protein
VFFDAADVEVIVAHRNRRVLVQDLRKHGHADANISNAVTIPLATR